MNSGGWTRSRRSAARTAVRSNRALTELEALTAVWTRARGQCRQVDGEAVPPEQGPPLAEGHPFEREEDVPGDEVLEPSRTSVASHNLVPSPTSPPAG